MAMNTTIYRLDGPAPETMPINYDLDALGYVEEEFVVSGAADSYRWLDREQRQAVVNEPAAYTTRVIVRRPAETTKFSGTVILEWQNVSAGMDIAPDWGFMHREIIRRGHAWVGVSAQRAGIAGGGLVEGLHLKLIAADRYEMLHHPGDAWSFDIFSQVGRLLRSEEGGMLGDAVAHLLLPIGHSQSAIMLVTYANVIDPLVRVFDGFLIHGRGVIGADLETGSPVGDTVGTGGDLAETARILLDAEPEPIRSDARVPVLVLQSETDTVALGGGRIPQLDGDKVRVWEIAGTAHGDTYLTVASLNDDGSSVERLAQDLRPVREGFAFQTPTLVNSGPQQHYVGQAALEQLNRWAAGGPPPPIARRLELMGIGDVQRDDKGIALGGVRTPWADVPVGALSGLGQGGDTFGFLLGTTKLFAPETIAELYPGGAEDYVSRFAAALDATIIAGFILQEDRDEIMAVAAMGFPTSALT